MLRTLSQIGIYAKWVPMHKVSWQISTLRWICLNIFMNYNFVLFYIVGWFQNEVNLSVQLYCLWTNIFFHLWWHLVISCWYVPSLVKIVQKRWRPCAVDVSRSRFLYCGWARSFLNGFHQEWNEPVCLLWRWFSGFENNNINTFLV